jgi:hypothetical protein
MKHSWVSRELFLLKDNFVVLIHLPSPLPSLSKWIYPTSKASLSQIPAVHGYLKNSTEVHHIVSNNS